VSARRLVAIVVNHGTPEASVRAVRSLQRSTLQPDGIVVVDNPVAGVSDTAPRSTTAEHLELIALPRNAGFTGGANAGLVRALQLDADVVLFLNSDAELEPDALALLLQPMANPQVGIAAPIIVGVTKPHRIESAGVRYAAASGRMRHVGAGRPADRAPLKSTTAVDGVSGCAMLVRRDVVDRIGGFFEPFFFSFEDLDYCLRAKRAGFTTVVVPQARALHAGSLSIGRRSPDRLYYATRNHLLLAERHSPNPSRTARLLRRISVVALSLVHAVRRSADFGGAGIASTVRGAWHHWHGRYGAA
jgi:GT2 family glycosyltransferase